MLEQAPSWSRVAANILNILLRWFCTAGSGLAGSTASVSLLFLCLPELLQSQRPLFQLCSVSLHDKRYCKSIT